MTAAEVLKELESYSDPNTKKVLMNHGAKEPFFGVKVADLKKILKKTKKDHALALELYDTGNSDAMYLAGLMADEKQITEDELNHWVKNAYWYYLSEYAVAWVAGESELGFSIGLKWIESHEEQVAAAGWATLASYASVRPDDRLDVKAYDSLLDRVEQNIHNAQNRVRYVMNGFVIAIGSFIPTLTDKAITVAQKIGKVEVDVGGTACKVPLATTYIQKVIDRGTVGKKKRQARC